MFVMKKSRHRDNTGAFFFRLAQCFIRCFSGRKGSTRTHMSSSPASRERRIDIIFFGCLLLGKRLRPVIPIVALAMLTSCSTPIGRAVHTTFANATDSSPLANTGVSQPLEYVYSAAPLKGRYLVGD